MSNLEGHGRDFEGTVKPSAIEVDAYEKDLFATRYTEIPSNMHMKADYVARTDGQPVYLGYAPRGLATSVSGWLLQKFTYDGNSQCTDRSIAYDSWDNHTTATYA